MLIRTRAKQCLCQRLQPEEMAIVGTFYPRSRGAQQFGVILMPTGTWTIGRLCCRSLLLDWWRRIATALHRWRATCTRFGAPQIRQHVCALLPKPSDLLCACVGRGFCNMSVGSRPHSTPIPRLCRSNLWPDATPVVLSVLQAVLTLGFRVRPLLVLPLRQRKCPTADARH